MLAIHQAIRRESVQDLSYALNSYAGELPSDLYNTVVLRGGIECLEYLHKVKKVPISLQSIKLAIMRERLDLLPYMLDTFDTLILTDLAHFSIHHPKCFFLIVKRLPEDMCVELVCKYIHKIDQSITFEEGVFRMCCSERSMGYIQEYYTREKELLDSFLSSGVRSDFYRRFEVRCPLFKKLLQMCEEKNREIAQLKKESFSLRLPKDVIMYCVQPYF